MNGRFFTKVKDHMHGHTFLVKFVYTKNVIKLKKTCSNCPPLVIIYIMVVECEEEYYLVGFA
jgi:hypothetical protein